MTVEVSIENIGGIKRARTSVEPGLNVVRGANWQGKTSFVQALEAALGLPSTVTEGAEVGSVTLSGPDIDASVEVQADGASGPTGSPILESETARTKAELYACLGESNPIRTAVRNGENLEAVLTRPLDLENIDQRIGELKAERDRIDTEIEKAENSKSAIPTVKERIETLRTQIEEYETRLDELEPESGEGVTDTREELSQARSRRSRLQSEVERLERSIERYEEKIDEKQSERDSITIEEIDVRAQDIEAKKRELDELRSDIKVLESLFTANNLLLEENSLELISEVQHGLDTDAFACWICGSETTRSEVEDHVDALGDRLQVHRSQLNEAKGELDEMETKYERRQQQKQRKELLEEEITDLKRELEEKETRLADRRSELSELEDRIETLSEAVDESVEEITDVESELKFRRSELEEAQDELEQHQRSAYRLEQLEERRADLREELTELRDRKSAVKTELRETFHETIGEIVEAFETGFESARLTTDFDLVVARGGREADREALSEGELEVLGFVAALAGYEAFDVAETVPVLLLDGLEALSDSNLHSLVEYFERRAEYVVVTAHPEHTEFEGQQIDPTVWNTVTGGTEVTGTTD